jgi:hypothetical protein
MTTPPDDDVDPRSRTELVAACRHLAARGLSPGSSGNVSVRLDDGVLLVTPSSTCTPRTPPRWRACRPVRTAARCRR